MINMRMSFRIKSTLRVKKEEIKEKKLRVNKKQM